MVTRGQFLERPTLIPVGKATLEGLSHRGTRTPPLLVVSPLPGSGGMDHVIAAELTWAAASEGFATLRFNFRGVGASQGKSNEASVDDIEAAAQLLVENTGARRIAIASIGGSSDWVLGWARGRKSVAGVALVSPTSLTDDSLQRHSSGLLVVMGEEDLRHPRAQVADSVARAGGQFELVDQADASFLRNLPQVGKVVSQWLSQL